MFQRVNTKHVSLRHDYSGTRSLIKTMLSHQLLFLRDRCFRGDILLSRTSVHLKKWPVRLLCMFGVVCRSDAWVILVFHRGGSLTCVRFINWLWLELVWAVSFAFQIHHYREVLKILMRCFFVYFTILEGSLFLLFVGIFDLVSCTFGVDVDYTAVSQMWLRIVAWIAIVAYILL